MEQYSQQTAYSPETPQEKTFDTSLSPESEKIPPPPQKPTNPRALHPMTVITVLIFVILSIGLVAFFYYQNQQLKKMLTNNPPTPSPNTSPTPFDLLANWLNYADSVNKFSFKYPREWSQTPTPTGTGNSPLTIFKSTDGLYRLTTEVVPNLNSKSLKPFESLDEFIGLPYAVKSLTIDGQEARQPFPQAGSENINKVYFFSKDLKNILSFELLVGDGTLTDHRVTIEALQIGSDIFDKILSTIKLDKVQSPEPVFCTQEAKLCPDGSYVGRGGPNCEFAPCTTPR